MSRHIQQIGGKRFWSWLGLACGAALIVGGCGGDSGPAPKTSSSPSSSAGGSYGSPGYGPGYGGSSPSGEAAETPQRPEDVKAWTDQDMLDAKKEGDPRLGEAALAYARAKQGDESAGEFLTGLITKEPEPEGESAEGNSPYGANPYSNPYGPRRASYAAYGGTEGGTDGFAGVIAALGVSNTKASRQALRQILQAKLPTPLDDAQATSAALKALTDNRNPAHEAILLDVLTAPETVRPAAPPAATATDAYADSGGVTAESLRSEALGLVAPGASAQLRTKLASDMLAKAKAPGALGSPETNPVLAFLLEGQPDNVEAQAALYRHPQLDPDSRARIEANFLAFSSSALREMLALPLAAANEDGLGASVAGGSAPNPYGRPTGRSPYGPGPAYGRPSAAPYAAPAAADAYSSGFAASGEPARETALSPEQAARVAGSLWRDDLVAALMARLPKGRVERSEATPEINQPLLLLASMPVEPARAALSRWLERQRDEAPDALLNAGAFEQAMIDPGLLTVVKPLAYEKRPARRLRRGADETAGAPAGPYGAPGAAAGANQDDDPLRSLIEALCRQARESGRSGGVAGDAFPIAFQGESTPSVQLAGAFPGSAKVSGVKPTPVSIRYAYLEQEHKLRTVEGHYRRQLNSLFDSPKVKQLDDGVWLDTLHRDRKTGKVRSVDVFIRRASEEGAAASAAYPGAPAAPGGQAANTRRRGQETENLTVEILIVETQAPPDDKPAAQLSRLP